MQKFDSQRLSALSLEISAIRALCHTWRSPRNHRAGGLIAFDGRYQHGSAGADDARAIRWRLREFIELARVDGIVIDCTRLVYEWGDDLSFTTVGNVPMLVVLAHNQLEAYRYAINEDRIRLSLNAALEEMDSHIRGMKSLL